MPDFATRRQENIKQNQTLLQSLGLRSNDNGVHPSQPSPSMGSVKRKANPPAMPTRYSKRIAETGMRKTYSEEVSGTSRVSRRTSKSSRREKLTHRSSSRSGLDSESAVESPEPSRESIVAGWTTWRPEAPQPTRDTDGTFYFQSHPDFRPNKSPEEIIREGSFGGSYWRPIRSKHLGIDIQDDWKELPEAWTAGLDIGKFLTNTSYDAEINKYGVACGQSIEEWEAAGWIAHEYDVRGWFQWYCRFWMGRRCPDDNRQVSRWKKCVGETGRWRRILLKKYVKLGIRSVFDDEAHDYGDSGDVSPVVHQTCHHWAYEVRQDALDRFWANGT